MSNKQSKPVNEAFPVNFLKKASTVQNCFCCDHSKKINVEGVLIFSAQEKRFSELVDTFPKDTIILKADGRVIVIVFACAEHMQKLIKLSSEMEGQSPMLFSADMIESL